MRKIVIAQRAYCPGKIEENLNSLLKAYNTAVTDGAELVVAPMMSICGFNPGELLCYSDYIKNCCDASEKLISQSKDIPILFDLPLSMSHYKPLWIWAQNGKAIKNPERLCFEDEKWGKVYVRAANELHFYPEIEKENLNTLILPDAHSIIAEHEEIRFKTLKHAASKIPNLIYANQAGGQEEYVLTGNSAFFTQNAKEQELYPWWKCAISGTKTPNCYVPPKTEMFYQALVIALKDYTARAGIKSCILGLSGGIDSSVVLPIAVDAMGADNVIGVMMPSPFSSEHSVNDAVSLAKNLGVKYEIIPIEKLYNTFLDEFSPFFGNTKFGLAEENLQARIRGNLLMGVSNKKGNLLLNTSNKSESACGYGTLYGDLCGGLALIGDLYKSEVYDLARYINRDREIIPTNCIIKAPSAELRPNQKDSDSLPDYDLIEKILRLHLEERYSLNQICEQVPNKEAVSKILRLFKNSAYKRRQTAPVIRLSNTVLADLKRPMMY